MDDGMAYGPPRVCIVGPLPPPSGGMANQCEQLVRLLRADGVPVALVRTNPPLGAVGRVPFLRAMVRLTGFLPRLWRGCTDADVMHVFANSGWAWHLMAAPALLVARWRRVPAIVNYRGGLAESFLESSGAVVVPLLASATSRVVPSAFLARVFGKHGLEVRVIPNVVDLDRFRFAPRSAREDAPHLVVTRNLERIYDVPTAIRAFAIVRRRFPAARLTVAGTGPELEALQALVRQSGLADAVAFPGRIENDSIARLYADADCMLNPSTADNMPISILEAQACGVPVVSTDAGGIPDLVQDRVSALLVPVGDAVAMAERAIEVLTQPSLRAALVKAGRSAVAKYSWSCVREEWLDAYRSAARARQVS